MRRRPPHRLATWLLARFARDYRRDSFIGDLQEEYEKRGHWWYWRQVAAVLVLRASSLPFRQHNRESEFLALAWAGAWRKRPRTALTLLSIATAFLIVDVMGGIHTQFGRQIDAARLGRILVHPQFGHALPFSYVAQIEAIPGVARACPTAGHGGTYRGLSGGIGILMTDDCILDVDPEFAITAAQFQRLKSVRNGVIVSRKTAQRLNWEVGKTYALQTPTSNRAGATKWSFKVVMVAPDNPTFYGGYALGNYAYLDENRADGAQGQVVNGPIVVRTKDQARSAEISNAIQRMFATKRTSVTATPARERLAKQLQNFLDIEFDTYVIAGAALFGVLVLTATVMNRSVKERASEFALMKARGTTDRTVFLLILCEALIQYMIGAAIGLALSEIAPVVTTKIIGGNAQVVGLGFMTPLITPTVVAWSLALASGIAVLSGLPAASRLRHLGAAGV